MNAPLASLYRAPLLLLVRRYAVTVDGQADGYVFGVNREDAWLNLPNYDYDSEIYLDECPDDKPPRYAEDRRSYPKRY